MHRAVLPAWCILHKSSLYGSFSGVVSSSSYCLYARCRMSIFAAAALAGSCYKNVWNTACLTCCEDASCRASGMVYIAQVQLVRQFLRYLWFRLAASSSYCLYARCHMSILAVAPLAGSCYKNMWNTACLTCCEDASCRASGMVYIAQVQFVQQFLRYVWFRLALIACMLAAT